MKTSDLRVISGRYKGQRLRSPESALTHPMGAREKLALFNMLQPFLSANDGSKVLDLYAGSGALGIEALSRGASAVVFVEKSPRIARTISANLTGLPDSAHAQVIVSIAADFCRRPAYQAYFDIIIADPPYDAFQPADLAAVHQLLAPSGVLALSSPANLDAPEIPGLQPVSTHTYAAARLTIYRLAN